MKLRHYQSKFHDEALDYLNRSGSTLGVMATGLGKTVVFCHLVESILQANPNKRAMIVAHREELVFQAGRKYADVNGGDLPEIEMADQSASSNTLLSRSLVVVASVQTLNSGKRCRFCHSSEIIDDYVELTPDNPDDPGACPHCVNGLNRRMQKFEPNDFSVLVIDEAHHSTAQSYRNLIEYFREGNSDIKILGVTATPDRHDEEALGQIYETCCFDYGILDGINDGWLVPIEQHYVECEHLDFSKVRTRCGDLAENDLESLMLMEETAHEVVTPTIEIVGDRPTLFFGVTVAHAMLMEEILNRHREGSAICIHGKTPKDERRKLLKEFSEGRYQYLCGCGVFLEGFDEVTIAAIAMARPTKSRALYAQAVGRGTRPLAPPDLETSELRREAIQNSEKPNLLVLDFVGNAAQHKLISTADILGGEYSDSVVELAAERVRLSGEGRNMQEVLLDIQEELEERRRQEAEERRKRAAVKAEKSSHRTVSIDPFDVLDISAPRIPGYLKGTPATEKQAQVLKSNGIDPSKYNTREASSLIGEIFGRREKGLCTFKQAKLLSKFGQPTDIGFEEASAIIDAIAKNGWKPIERVSV